MTTEERSRVLPMAMGYGPAVDKARQLLAIECQDLADRAHRNQESPCWQEDENFLHLVRRDVPMLANWADMALEQEQLRLVRHIEAKRQTRQLMAGVKLVEKIASIMD